MILTQVKHFLLYLIQLPQCLKWYIKHKPNLKPHISPDDPRLKVQNFICYIIIIIYYLFQQWLEGDFLDYLRLWEDFVNNQTKCREAKFIVGDVQYHGENKDYT